MRQHHFKDIVKSMFYYVKDIEHVLASLKSSQYGLDNDDAAKRLIQYGQNVLPKASHISIARLFFKQFLDPLIYVLLFAALMSLLIANYTDAGFIFFVFVVNALIGFVQEYSAQHSAASLNTLVSNIAKVIRSGDTYEINARDLVPGDVVLLESGDMVPADLRLINQQELRIDESLLSGESLPVEKDASVLFEKNSLIQERINMTFSDTLVINGRALGVVDVALAFEPGEGDELTKPPRKPDEAIFNRVMIERVLLSAMVIGLVAFASFYYLLNTGMSLDAARNGTLLLMVLFENIHVQKQSLFYNKVY